MVSYCDRWMSVVCCPSLIFASNDNISLTTGWSLTKLGKNDPYMALFENCSNGSGLSHKQGYIFFP